MDRVIDYRPSTSNIVMLAESHHFTSEPRSLKPSVVQGHLAHKRLHPKPHAFDYSITSYVLPLHDLDSINQSLPLFSINRWNICSFFESDYLTWGTGPLRQRLGYFLTTRGIQARDDDDIMLVTSPRLFGHVFNPVSFYFGYRKNGDLAWFVAEINNTYWERHCYVGVPEKQENGLYYLQQKKSFHVSPFFSGEGDYRFTFADIRERLDISIDILREGEPVFTSRFWGELLELNRRTHLSTLLNFPLTSLLTLPRIHWQAILLMIQRRLPVLSKPNSTHALTIRAEPYSWAEQASMKLAAKRLAQIQRGSLEIVFPDGRRDRYGTAGEGFHGVMQLNNFKTFLRTVLKGGIGFGESYIDGDWDSPCLAETMGVLLDNFEATNEQNVNLIKPLRFLETVKHFFKGNSIRGSKSNIQAHYDLGNDLFSAFLDPTLSYSSAIFKTPGDSLEEAQKNKINILIEKLKLCADDHLLEIGSGWGSFAIEAARQRGCRVTSITISHEQLTLARKRVQDAGVAHLVSIEFCDYREITGMFTKIVSVEMLEAVGKEYLSTFFETIDRHLARDGIAAVQVISYPDQQYADYLTRADWIQKYIFPGSHLPSLSAIQEVLTKNTSLMIDSVENYGNHYAKTLQIWREQFLAAFPSLTGKGYDERFRRMWEYYLASCQAEFQTRWIGVLQIVLNRANNRSLFNQ